GAFLMIATTAIDIGKAVIFFPVLERNGRTASRSGACFVPHSSQAPGGTRSAGHSGVVQSPSE
ncbi:hypothetical protein AB0F44_06425, partial [Nocardioides sp. NPDC023903]|uniref:hypothetical protein n=1 Tax=Nocardioides sp. NPDC023903 TaxID=3157195 RepID=UPI0033EE67DF